MKAAIAFVLFAIPSSSFAQYCQEKTPSSWLNCVEGSASDAGTLSEMHEVVVNGISLSGFPLRIEGSSVVLDGAPAPLGSLSGAPSVIAGVRYDQELALSPGVQATQEQDLGAKHSSCFRNALNVCMKNATQDLHLRTTLKIGAWNHTVDSDSSVPLGETPGFFCCG